MAESLEIYRDKAGFESPNFSEANSQLRGIVERRAMDGIANFTSGVNSGDIPMSVAFQCVTILIDIVSPVVSAEVRKTFEELHAHWAAVSEEDRRNREIEAAADRANEETRRRLEKVKQGEIQAEEEFVF